MLVLISLAVQHHMGSHQQCNITWDLISSATSHGISSAVQHHMGSHQQCNITWDLISSATSHGISSAVQHHMGSHQQCNITWDLISSATSHGISSAVQHHMGSHQQCNITWDLISSATSHGIHHLILLPKSYYSAPIVARYVPQCSWDPRPFWPPKEDLSSRSQKDWGIGSAGYLSVAMRLVVASLIHTH